MLTRRAVLAASALIGLDPQPTRAQALKKTARIIVGFPAGGATDLLARILAGRLRGNYAASVVVENKPGGAARVAVDYVKNAEPDGSEFLFTPDFPITCPAFRQCARPDTMLFSTAGSARLRP
jgi:tripartite-type tricarboxylate transporter receptor subunit TctC